MPLDRLVLMIVAVIAAAAATVWLAAVLTASSLAPGGLFLLVPAALVAYVVIRVIADRMRDPEDDHYDGMR